MLPFLEDKYGNKYEFKEVSRRAKIRLSSKLKEVQTKGELSEQFDALESIGYDILSKSYENLTREQYEELLDYNEREYGFQALYSIIEAGITGAFTQEDMEKKVHPYLAEKMKKVEETQTEQVTE